MVLVRNAVLAAAVCVLASCGSDEPDTGTTAAGTSPGTTVAPLADCPFTGTTEPSEGGQDGSAAVLSSVTTSKSGCIDSLTFEFSTPPPSWSVEYSAGPFVDASGGSTVSVPGPETLVITFADTSYADHSTPTEVSPDDLDYVTAIDVVAGPDGSLQWVLSLDRRAEYQTSMSTVPSNFVLGIG